jgi:hypothetical protein
MALALAARAEGKGAWQPINATSHWRNGDEAAAHRGIDGAHTGIGYATKHAACIFWAQFLRHGAPGVAPRGRYPCCAMRP